MHREWRGGTGLLPTSNEHCRHLTEMIACSTDSAEVGLLYECSVLVAERTNNCLMN